MAEISKYGENAMINQEKLSNANRIEVSYINANVDKEFVKNFRRKYNLTQITLANILGVTKKAVEKWEQGINRVNGSSAVLLRLLSENPELLQQVYCVNHKANRKSTEN